MGRRVHSGSRVFTQAHLGVAGFKRVPVVLLRRAYGLSGSSGLAWVHSDALREVVGLIRVRVCSHGRALRSSGSFG